VPNHVEATAEAVESHIGGWRPESAADLDLFLASLPLLFEAVSNSIIRVAATLGADFPVDAAVPERLHEIAATVAGMADFSAEAHAVHRVAHAAELERIENPRPNEQIWDVAQNQ
jgi:hypothetical protein